MRHPEYNPTFSDEEIKAAEEVSRRRNAPHVQVQRARLALYLHKHPGVFSTVAADALGMHEQTVRKWRKRWAQEGFALGDRPRPGRPKRFSP